MKTTFLDASSHLYKRVCPSVGASVGPSVCPPFFFVWITATLNNSGQLWTALGNSGQLWATLGISGTILDNSWTHLLVNSWPCFLTTRYLFISLSIFPIFMD